MKSFLILGSTQCNQEAFVREASGVRVRQRRYEGEVKSETKGATPLTLKMEGEATSDVHTDPKS